MKKTLVFAIVVFIMLAGGVLQVRGASEEQRIGTPDEIVPVCQGFLCLYSREGALVKRFSSNGVFEKEIINNTAGEGLFPKEQKRMCVSDGYVFVAMCGDGRRITRFYISKSPWSELFFSTEEDIIDISAYEGNIYVVSEKRIIKISPSGEKLMEWGKEWKKGKIGRDDLYLPRAIDVSKEGVFLADNRSVIKYSYDGKFLGRYDTPEPNSYNDFAELLEDIEVRQGKVYVLDQESHEVKVVDAGSLKFLKAIKIGSFIPDDSYVHGNGERSLGVDIGGNIYVADDNGRCVKVSPEGKLLWLNK